MSVQVHVVKSQMFNTEFWLGTLNFAAVAKYILPPEDQNWDPIFGKGEEEAQRKLNKRRVTSEMVPYLLANDDAFFSSLALVLVPLTGEYLVEGRDYRFEPSADQSKIGTLSIEDHVHMFPADGQHRSAAITEALRQDRGLYQQEVPVVFLPFRGKDKVRQLFSDLNLNAKPVSKTIGYAFETRDSVVVATKRVMREVPLFENRVNERTNSLPFKSPDVITMNTLVQAHEAILGEFFSVKAKGKTFRDHEGLQAIHHLDPMDDKVEPVAQRLTDVWEVVIGAIPEWEGVLTDHVTPGELREGKDEEDSKGYIFGYGIGWQAIALVAAALIRHKPEDWSEDLGRCIRAVDWRKGPHWNGIAMIGDRVNNTGPGIRATAGYLLEKGGFTDEDGNMIKSLLQNLATSRTTVDQAA